MTKQDFKILFDTYFDTIRNFIYYKSGDAEIATDLAQDVFMKIWEKQQQIESATIKGLLYKMASDAFRSFYRKQRSRLNYANSFRFETESSSVEEQLHFDELNQKYQLVLQQMPEKKRVVFLMSRMDNLKYSEIAEQLDISVKTVEKRMSEALTLLKNALLIVLLILIWYYNQ